MVCKYILLMSRVFTGIEWHGGIIICYYDIKVYLSVMFL